MGEGISLLTILFVELINWSVIYVHDINTPFFTFAYRPENNTNKTMKFLDRICYNMILGHMMWYLSFFHYHYFIMILVALYSKPFLSYLRLIYFFSLLSM